MAGHSKTSRHSHRHRHRSRSPDRRHGENDAVLRAERRHRHRHNNPRSSRSLSPPRQRPDGVEEVSADDYFRLNPQFRLWLKKEKGKYFDELPSDKNRRYFGRFVDLWNKGQLKGE
ncbi:hypothetical protein EV182_002100 [Spiromyces aspiralis]|uniref:Uncharacterized protein n=1 Tax=Spiromyces aspiralis TaxID=68401 RepID=A0ACC1HSY6_9FUNG|nr:hypothetical protein EV182_002100 [Spiromyces aspiralis]